MGGGAVTFKVEKRDRFPVRVRYAGVDRTDEESIRRLLISAGNMGSSTGGSAERMSSPQKTETEAVAALPKDHAASPPHAAKRKTLIPLSAFADVPIGERPALTKSEKRALL